MSRSSTRNAHEAREEKIKIINGLAEWYEKQGLKVLGLKPLRGSDHNEVLDAVIKALDEAISDSFIRVGPVGPRT